MSIEALNWALGHMQRAELSTNVRFVLMILANRADPEGVCWPSVRYIRARTGLADSTVRECCKQIADLGLLEIEHQARTDGGKGTNRYNLCISATPPPPPGDTPPPHSGGTHPRESAGVPPHTGGQETKEETPLTDVKGPARSTKKFQMPEGFGVSEDVTKWALEHGLLASYVGQQFEAFCDDARANRRMHADWDAALKTWLRRQPNFDRTAPRPMRRGGHREDVVIDRRCFWPRRDAPDRCTVTADEDKDGSWLGRGVFACCTHVKCYIDDQDASRRAVAAERKAVH